MTRSRVLLDFPEFKWFLLVHFAMYISSLFFACAFILAPPFTKVVFDAAIADLQSKGVAAMGKDKVKIRERDSALLVVVNMLREAASYVDMVCGGDLVKILLTGFNAFTPKGHGGTTIFTVIQGLASGSVDADWPNDVNAHSYIIRYSINEEGLRDVYTQVSAGTIGCTITGLTKTKEYMFSLASVYSNSQGEFGDPVFLIVI